MCKDMNGKLYIQQHFSYVVVVRQSARRKPEYQGKPEYKEKARVLEDNLSTRENLNVKRKPEY
jgi:hypothetical protein